MAVSGGATWAVSTGAVLWATGATGAEGSCEKNAKETKATAAMLAAESLAGAGLDMLKRLQTAYYAEGRHISEREELVSIAVELGLDAEAFSKAYDQAMLNVGEHFRRTQVFLEALGGRGYPTLAIEQDGKLSRLPLGRYFGKPELFRKALADLLASAQAAQ